MLMFNLTIDFTGAILDEAAVQEDEVCPMEICLGGSHFLWKGVTADTGMDCSCDSASLILMH